MATIIIIFDIKWNNSKNYNKTYKSLVSELSKGRPKSQIVFDKSVCFLSTPESSNLIANRIIEHTNMDSHTDGFIVLDIIRKSVLIWGDYSEKIEETLKKLTPIEFTRLS